MGTVTISRKFKFVLVSAVIAILCYVISPLSSKANYNAPQTIQSIGGRTEVFAGQGFDKCEVPDLASLQNWFSNSPYRAVNIYGGLNRGCPNSGLTATFLLQVARQGWKFIPTWVGRQSACWTGASSYRISNDPTTAYNQGVEEADLAVDWAKNLGLTFPDGSGTVIYNDLEAGPSSSTDCLNAAKSYISGWVYELHFKGNTAGVYGSSCASAISAYSSISNAPDVVWPAGGGFYSDQYSPDATVWGINCISDDLWNNHQRIYQYTAGHSETWGGISLTVDSNVIDGVVAVIPLTPYDDGFNSATLDPKWHWIREDPTHWSLSASQGNLRMITQRKDIWRNTNNAPLLLQALQPLSNDDFEIRTRVVVTPTANFHQGGLVIYSDDDNYVRFTYAYIDRPTFEFAKETGGNFQPIQVPAPSGVNNFHLRIEKIGVNYYGYYSQDGNNWILIGKHQNVNISPSQIGLLAFNGYSNTPIEIPADFDYFVLKDISYQVFLPSVIK